MLARARHRLPDESTMAERLNRVMPGWTNYSQSRPVSPACQSVDKHAIKRPRQWLCREQRVSKYARCPDERPRKDLGLACLVMRTASFPCRGRRHDLEREPGALCCEASYVAKLVQVAENTTISRAY